MREKPIEQYLRERVEAAGGRCYKWVSPGNPGVPDRIVFLPDRAIQFVETKSTVGTLRPSQKRQMKRIYELGFGEFLFVISSKDQVDLFMKEMGV